MRLKVTSYTDLGNNFVQWNVRECDDNPDVLPDQLSEVEILDINLVSKIFTNCKLEGKNADIVESNGMLVHPYIYRYETMT